jgi:hypothetical protein
LQQIVCSASSVICPVGMDRIVGAPQVAFSESPVRLFDV